MTVDVATLQCENQRKHAMPNAITIERDATSHFFMPSAGCLDDVTRLTSCLQSRVTPYHRDMTSVRCHGSVDTNQSTPFDEITTSTWTHVDRLTSSVSVDNLSAQSRTFGEPVVGTNCLGGYNPRKFLTTSDVRFGKGAVSLNHSVEKPFEDSNVRRQLSIARTTADVRMSLADRTTTPPCALSATSTRVSVKNETKHCDNEHVSSSYETLIKHTSCVHAENRSLHMINPQSPESCSATNCVDKKKIDCDSSRAAYKSRLKQRNYETKRDSEESNRGNNMTYLCNQHLLPQKLCKLVVPDDDKMKQLGSNNVWYEQLIKSVSKNQRCDAKYKNSKKSNVNTTLRHFHETKTIQPSNISNIPSPGTRITTEELFANYEAAVLGKQKTRWISSKGLEASVENLTTISSLNSTISYNAHVKEIDPKEVFPSNVGSYTKHRSTEILYNSSSQHCTQSTPRASFGTSIYRLHNSNINDSSNVFTDQQPHCHYNHQMFTIHNQAVSHKSRKHHSSSPFYSYNTKPNDALSYTGLNATFFPRLSILTNQIAAQNTFVLKVNSQPTHRHVQPTVPMPPPGFIPLIPIQSGPLFPVHHTGTYRVSPVFQRGLMQPHGFVTMSAHPPLFSFIPQATINHCSNFINGTVLSATVAPTKNDKNNDQVVTDHNGVRL